MAQENNGNEHKVYLVPESGRLLAEEKTTMNGHLGLRISEKMKQHVGYSKRRRSKKSIKFDEEKQRASSLGLTIEKVNFN